MNYLIVIVFAFLTLQFNWFFPWDTIDLILFTCFAYGITKAFPISYFLPLFIFGIFNRESALFISIYLILDSFKFTKGQLLMQFIKSKSLIAGISLFIAGTFYIKFIRSILFISKPNGLLDKNNELLGNHIYFLSNLKDLFLINFTNYNFFVSIFIFVSFGYFISNFRKMDDRQLKLLIMYLIILSSIIVFGLLNETRLYFIILPFFLFLWLSLNMKIKNFFPSN